MRKRRREREKRGKTISTMDSLDKGSHHSSKEQEFIPGLNGLKSSSSSELFMM